MNFEENRALIIYLAHHNIIICHFFFQNRNDHQILSSEKVIYVSRDNNLE